MAEQEVQTPNVDTDFDLFSDEFSTPNMEETPQGDPAEPASPNAVQDDQTPAQKTTPRTASKANFRREIDLGDGSGKQVFEADTAEALIDKLTTAQENATRKIREQQFELKRAQRARPEKEAPKPTIEIGQPKDLTADELFQLGQELQRNPAAAFDKILQSQTGLNAATLKAIGEQYQANQYEAFAKDATQTFLKNHEGVDYLPSPQNAQTIQKFLQDEELPYTAANLEYAFQELSESGLLDMPESVEVEAKPSSDGKGSQDQRISVPAHTRRKPMTTGLSNRQSSSRPTEEVKTESGLSESEVEQLYKMPLEDARQLMLKKMRVASGSR